MFKDRAEVELIDPAFQKYVSQDFIYLTRRGFSEIHDNICIGIDPKFDSGRSRICSAGPRD